MNLCYGGYANMSCQCEQQKSKEFLALEEVLKTYAHVPGSLITVLQKTQDIYGYLPQEILCHIAKEMHIKLANIIGVATFYAQFRFEPVGEYLIMLCQGTACHVNGSERIEQVIQQELGITDGQTTDDGLFTLKNVACLGCCSLSPVMMINDETYGHLTQDSVRKILHDLAAKGVEA